MSKQISMGRGSIDPSALNTTKEEFRSQFGKEVLKLYFPDKTDDEIKEELDKLYDKHKRTRRSDRKVRQSATNADADSKGDTE